jgi:hypothetical protein
MITYASFLFSRITECLYLFLRVIACPMAWSPLKIYELSIFFTLLREIPRIDTGTGKNK